MRLHWLRERRQRRKAEDRAEAAAEIGWLRAVAALMDAEAGPKPPADTTPDRVDREPVPA